MIVDRRLLKVIDRWTASTAAEVCEILVKNSMVDVFFKTRSIEQLVIARDRSFLPLTLPSSAFGFIKSCFHIPIAEIRGQFLSNLTDSSKVNLFSCCKISFCESKKSK